MEDFDVIEIDPLKNEGLPNEVIGGVVEILGGKSCLINLLETGISSINDGLFHQLHYSSASCNCFTMASVLRFARRCPYKRAAKL